jgi:hypothetical protein
MECLGSFVRRVGTAGVEPSPQVPAMFVGESASSSSNGALSAVALLLDGNIPFCGGLLRPDGKLVTAYHCLRKMRPAFNAGKIRVVSADGRNGPYHVNPAPIRQPAVISLKTADDWAVFQLLDSKNTPLSATPVPPTNLVAASALGEVNLVAHYAYYAATQYADQPQSEWAKALRFQKPGLCQIVSIPTGCIQVACQTIRGFSGMPVFQQRASGAASPAPEIIGFVSGADAHEGQCNGLVSDQTALVAASNVKL